MGAVFFGDKLTLSSALGTLLVLFGVLLVTMRSSSTSSKADKDATCTATAVTTEGSQKLPCEADSDRMSLLSDHHIHSHLAPADHSTSAQLAENAAGVAGALAVVRLRSAGSLGRVPKQPPGPHVGFAEDAEQLLAAARADSAAIQDDGMQLEEGEPGLIAQIAASAAAALGGELCPAGSVLQAMELSRQVSRQLAFSRAVSQISRQPSQYLFGSPSAFLTAPGLPGVSALPWAQPVSQPQQQSQVQPVARQVSQRHGSLDGVQQVGHSQSQQQHSRVEGQEPAAAAAGGGLKQALLPGDSTPSSPVSSPSSVKGVLQQSEQQEESDKH
jgi:hypothetical protein